MARSGKAITGFEEPAKKALLSYGWPGNVRELENVVERAIALAQGTVIRLEDLPVTVRERKMSEADSLASALSRGMTLDELEREYILRVVRAEGGNKTRAAQRLGLDRKTLYRKLEEYAAPAEATPAGGTVDPEQDANADVKTPPPLPR